MELTDRANVAIAALSVALEQSNLNVVRNLNSQLQR